MEERERKRDQRVGKRATPTGQVWPDSLEMRFASPARLNLSPNRPPYRLSSEKRSWFCALLSSQPDLSSPSRLPSLLPPVAPFPITMFPSSQLAMNGFSASPFSSDLLWLPPLVQGESVCVFWATVSSAASNILGIRGPHGTVWLKIEGVLIKMNQR